MDTNNLPDRELTPTELRQLIEGNARAIRANSELGTENRESIAQLRQAIAETRAIADSNARAIEANSNEIAESRRALVEVANLVREVGVRTDDRIDRLAELVRSFVATQISTNHEMDDRISALEATIREAGETE